MYRFMILTFVFLGFVFFELSGGSDFDADAVRAARVEPSAQLTKPDGDVVRVALNLTSNAQITPKPAGATGAAWQAAPTFTQEIRPQSNTRTTTTAGSAPFIAPNADVRRVTAARVNVRDGPGTDYSVINSLGRGTEVEVLTTYGNGWVQLRPVAGGTVGWIAESLLSKG